MTDDRIVKESARDPEREALGSVRGGLRAAAKKAVRKVAKKAARKKVASKAAASAGKSAARGAASARKADRAARTAAASASGPAGASSAGTGAASVTAATARAQKAAVADPAASSESVATVSAAPVAPSREAGPAFDTPRPPGPMHPGAVMDSMQEQSGGLGGLLALWGPLIIVGFLVLVFRGGEELETAVATGTDAPRPATADVAAAPARVAVPSGAAPGAAETFEGGFAMRTSMAGPPTHADRGVHAGGPAVAPGALYPSPPGPYRDPRYRSLPTGESWAAAGTDEWMWSAEARTGARPAGGGDAPVRWVRCEAPYYWCPAPSSPAW